jgi:cbb3-type cytochrome oxidase maturation protein
MSVIYLLISISIIVAVAFLYAFLRAVKTGQYDDDYTPSVRMLFDDELIKKNLNSKIVNLSLSEVSAEETELNPITKKEEQKPN